MLADLESRVATVDGHRRRARLAATVRVALVAAIALLTIVAMVGVPFGAVVGAAACCEAMLKPRPWLLIVVFLGSGLLTVAAGAAIAVWVYRALGGGIGRRYRRTFLGLITKPLLASALPAADVDVERGLAREELERSALFPPNLNYDTSFRVASRDGTWLAGDVKAWHQVAAAYGSDSSSTLLTWLHGLYGWIASPCPVSTPVLVVGEAYHQMGRGMARRSDIVAGTTGDPAFDGVLQVCVGNQETAVPPIPAALRGALLALRERFGDRAFFSLTPAGVAVAAPVYGRILDDSRRPLEPRLLAVNDAGELQREADLVAAMDEAAGLLARANSS